MELSHDEVRRIAELAKLDLTDDEISLYAGQLSHILAYFESLKEVDTSQIAPTASVLPLKNVFRADVAGPALTPEEVIRNAPDSMDDQFFVSAVVDEQNAVLGYHRRGPWFDYARIPHAATAWEHWRLCFFGPVN